jgi:hypothetical protein
MASGALMEWVVGNKAVRGCKRGNERASEQQTMRERSAEMRKGAVRRAMVDEEKVEM